MAPPKQPRTKAKKNQAPVISNRITHEHLDRTKNLLQLAVSSIHKFELEDGVGANGNRRDLVYAENFLSKAAWNCKRAIETLVSKSTEATQ